jgi:peptidoglycan glycosyltransferase
LGWIALIVFLFLAAVGIIGALGSVLLFTSLSSDLDPVDTLDQYQLPEETVIYDRTGKIELARFGEYQRDVVTFEEIPPILLDATTAVEDKTFWENAGFDPVGIVAAGIDAIRGDARGASTITQQLVRARLLDPKLVQDPDRTIERKLKEIVQSIRLTQHFDGEDGKKQIITAYLNQNYYGNQAYGVKAAVRVYFGKELKDITPAEAAIIAALPKSPSNYDLVRNSEVRCTVALNDDGDCPAGKGELWVKPDSRIIARRNQILDLLAAGGRTPMSKDQYTSADFEAAKDDEVKLASQAQPRWVAPHFVWAVRDELTTKLCGDESETCDALDQGGLRVTTTLDVGLQAIAEKWVKAAAVVPQSKNPTKAAKALGFDSLPAWMKNLTDKDVHNGSLVALDYQTGELVAYVGSANDYSTSDKPEFQPQFDVAGQGYRQPGSAFKPFNYAVGIDEKNFTAGSMFMDVATDFGGGYSPNDADRLERGPVRVRKALQFSLNIPAVKAMAVNQTEHMFQRAKDFGMTFQSDTTDAGLTLALGTAETKPVDLVTAYGTLANGGGRIDHTSILTIQDRDGKDVVPPYVPPAPKQVVSPQAAFIVTDILRENTVRAVNPYWGVFQIRDANGTYRPATLKTGTNNDAKDLNAYGYIAPPTEQDRANGEYALAVGVWNGNSDNTPVSTPAHPVVSLDVPTYVWQGFLKEATADWPIARFARPDGLERVAIDPWTGAKARSGDPSVEEWFLPGTEPPTLAANTCGIEVLRDPDLSLESTGKSWMAANEDWIRRAERGPGTAGGPDRTRTTYFYNFQFNPYGRSWGVIVGGTCGQPSATPSCFPIPTPDASGIIPSFTVPSPDGSSVAALPCPPPSGLPSESPSVSPSSSLEPSPSVDVTPAPTEAPTPAPTEAPTPAPTEAPTPAPTEAPTAAPTEAPTTGTGDGGGDASAAP